MKLILIFTSIVILSSCFRFDKLEYYVEGYSPNNDALRTDGYYYIQGDSLHLDTWPNAVAEMYFLKNGTFVNGSTVEHIDSLDVWICKFGKRHFRNGPFGFYTIQNDTIKVECIATGPMVPNRVQRREFKAVKTENGMRIIQIGNVSWDEEWIFHENECVPDSVRNWLVKHRKYRLD